MSGWFRFRMAIDRVVAGLALVVASPVIGVAAVLVRRGDGGPALIAVPRIGRGGATFGMWKLRSMRAETGDGRARGVSLTSGEDDRITPIGSKLRAHHLDELPQLWNVVRGDMCLLGARPEAPEFVDRDDPDWQQVLAGPPGMAGATQLVVGDWEREVITAHPDGSAYRETVLPVKLAIDAWYAREASPRIDLLILGALLGRFVPRLATDRLVRVVVGEVPAARVVGARPTPSAGATAGSVR